MRKKSHLSLAGYIIDAVDDPMLEHPMIFRFGSLEPDLIPSFITTKHRIDLTLGKLEKKVRFVVDNYDEEKGMTARLSANMGIITHYIADYFTFPHNLEYPGNMRQHIHYEEILKRRFREFVREKKQDETGFESIQLDSVEEIMRYVCDKHDEYLEMPKSIQSDCEFILRVASQVMMAIFDLIRRRCQAQHILMQQI